MPFIDCGSRSALFTRCLLAVPTKALTPWYVSFPDLARAKGEDRSQPPRSLQKVLPVERSSPVMVSAAEDHSREYLRRDPERGVLYEVLAAHLETFLAHGFARFRCLRFGTDALVAFSFKGRGFCPFCGGKRMAESAAHLTDHVFPELPVRRA